MEQNPATRLKPPHHNPSTSHSMPVPFDYVLDEVISTPCHDPMVEHVEIETPEDESNCNPPVKRSITRGPNGSEDIPIDEIMTLESHLKENTIHGPPLVTTTTQDQQCQTNPQRRRRHASGDGGGTRRPVPGDPVRPDHLRWRVNKFRHTRGLQLRTYVFDVRRAGPTLQHQTFEIETIRMGFCQAGAISRPVISACFC